MNLSNILITGGTGSFGKEFVKNCILSKKYKKIIIYSRDELKQYEMKNELIKLSDNKKINIKNLRFFLGDIRDKDRLDFAMDKIDIVIHAAALKQVPAAEYNPFEFVKTNIIGSQNIIESALKNKVKKVLALSTDKASSPSNLYGATKLTADKMFIAANNYRGSNETKFSVIRYGNVMGSRGSVLPMIYKKIDSKIFPLTDKNMTRFNITLDESINFVNMFLKLMIGGELFVPKLPSFKVTDLVKAVSKDFNFRILGLRPGEKLHEEMISFSDSLNTLELKKFYIICPKSEFLNKTIDDYMIKYKNYSPKKIKKNFSYNSKSNKDYLKIAEIKKILLKNNFVNETN